jgi:hypothetical protein
MARDTCEGRVATDAAATHMGGERSGRCAALWITIDAKVGSVLCFDLLLPSPACSLFLPVSATARTA